MTTPLVSAEESEATEHPYIVRTPGIYGGRPRIKGSRISVRHIAQLYKLGETVEDMIQAHPHLTPASVYDALSYYLDHQAEIEQEIAESRLEALVDKSVWPATAPDAALTRYSAGGRDTEPDRFPAEF